MPVDAGDLGAAQLDVRFGDPERVELAADRARVIAAVEVQCADVVEQAGVVDGVEGGVEQADVIAVGAVDGPTEGRILR